MKQNRLSLVALAASALLLAACGGGGGGGGGAALPILPGAAIPAPAPAPSTPTAATPPATPATPAGASNIDATIQTASYASGSPQAVAYALLNAERVNCGFGALAQSTKLDQAAQAHVRWLLVNHYKGHYEDPKVTDGFTGNAPEDRAKAAGYVYYTGEATPSADGMYFFSGESIDQLDGVARSATTATRELLAAPYHLAEMMMGYREMGLGYLDSDAVGNTAKYGARTILNFNFGIPAGSSRQDPSASDVLTYPCQGSTGTALKMPPETPNPVPGRDLTANPPGQPVYVAVRHGQKLAITTASMTNLATGAAVALRAPSTRANDPNADGLLGNQGYVLPEAPLAANTGYQVTITGTNDGAAFSRTFTFTTGTGT